MGFTHWEAETIKPPRLDLLRPLRFFKSTKESGKRFFLKLDVTIFNQFYCHRFSYYFIYNFYSTLPFYLDIK